MNAVRGQPRTKPPQLPRATPNAFPKRVRAHMEKTPAGLSPDIERALRVIDALNEQVRDGDRALKAMAEGDQTCRRLMAVPGIGR